VISREVFLDHLINTSAISYSEDDSVVFAEKAFFAFRVAEWTYNKAAAGELDSNSYEEYWGLLSKYLSGEIDLKIENDMLYYDDTEEEQSEEGC
jgi:hypothetical protein